MSRKNWEDYFEAVRKQEWRSARDVLNDIAPADPANPLVYLRLGDVCQRLGDTNGAVKAYHQSAHMQSLAGFNHKALALYKIILRIRPDDAEALSRSGALMKELDTARAPRFTPPQPSEPQPEQLPAAALPGAVPPSQGSAANPDDAVIGGAGIASIEEMFSSLEDAGLRKTLDDLMVPLSERQAAASPVSELFEGMSEDEINTFYEGLEVRSYPDGTVVIEEGDSGDSLFMIRSGAARVVAHMFGRAIELARLVDGDLFGEVAFLTGRPRTASVVADGPLEVYEMTRLDVEPLIERNPGIMSRLEGFYETRVRDTVNKILPK